MERKKPEKYMDAARGKIAEVWLNNEGLRITLHGSKEVYELPIDNPGFDAMSGLASAALQSGNDVSVGFAPGRMRITYLVGHAKE